MTAATQHTTRSRDGTTIAYDQRGDGPPLVLVGGAFQYRAIDGDTALLAELLAERFTVVHYDRRGRGDSGDTPPYAVAREVDDIAALIAAVGGEAFVYGMSSGAVLALEAAASGLPISRLALYEPPFSPDDARETGAAAELIAKLRAHAEAGERDAAVALFFGGAGVPDEALPQTRRETLTGQTHEVAPDALAPALLAFFSEGR